MPRVLQLHLSWAETDEQALTNAMTEWPNGGMKFAKADIRSPHDFAAMAALVRPEDFEGRMVIRATPTCTAPRSSATSTSASTGSTCTTSDATRRSGSRSSAATCCRSCSGDGSARNRAARRRCALSSSPGSGRRRSRPCCWPTSAPTWCASTGPAGRRWPSCRPSGPARPRQALGRGRPEARRRRCDACSQLVARADVAGRGLPARRGRAARASGPTTACPATRGSSTAG